MYAVNSEIQGIESLSDLFGRRFEYLRLSVTDACNYRCNYCLPNGYRKQTTEMPLTVGEISTLAEAFARMGTRKIRLTGGEPSLRRDLPAIIRNCKRTAGIQEVALTTNGYSLRRHLHDWIEAGLDAVNISIDSLDPDTFAEITGQDHLEQVLEGLHMALKAGLRVKTNAVLLAGYNGSQVEEFLELIRFHPVSVRFIELMQTGDNATFFRQNHLTGAAIQTYLDSAGWKKKPRGPLNGPALEYAHPDYAGTVGLIMPYSKDFCATCNRLRVSSTGRLHLCLFADESASLREPLRQANVRRVCETVRDRLLEKSASHHLQNGYTGSTRNLSGLGG